MTDRTRLLSILLILCAGLALFNNAAVAFSLYWSVWWLDLVMHTIGGAAVALGILWFLYYAGYVNMPRPDSDTVLLFAVAGTIIIGGLWEAFEFALNVPHTEPYVIDTALDIAFDLIGACITFVYFSYRELPRLQQTYEIA